MAPTDKQWHLMGRAVRSWKEGKCSLFLLTVIFVLPLLLWKTSQNNSSIKEITKRELSFDPYDEQIKPENNAWYETMKVIARKITNESCYVCAQLPHGVGTTLPLKTIPLNTSETLGVLIAFTQGLSLKNRTVRDMNSKLKLLNISVVNYGGSTARFWDMSLVADQEIHQPVMTINPTGQLGTVCFTRQCFMAEDHYLGTSPCKQKVIATCGLRWDREPSETCRGNVPFVAQLNLTNTISLNRPGHDNPVVSMPSSDGYGSLREHVWVCGKYVYQSLRPGWCGTCYIARLVPSVTLSPNLTHFHTDYPHYYVPSRHKRSTVRVSPGEKGFGGFLPWWGTVNNAHKIDEIAMELENLTALVGEGFLSLSPSIQGIRNVALQNRVALDLMLASQGGVCHIIGTDCCTYIPDISDNMTHIVSHLNDLLFKEKSKDSQIPEGWNWGSWFTLTGWKNVLLKFLTPILISFCVLVLFACFIVPCVKTMVTSLIKSTIGQYVQLPETNQSWTLPFQDDEMI
ncbi:uncharacterized protein LOC132999740 [Limanda limanda]|uniref:uncharacterized protein LOC132999740 n=1 Tax=Limanda limanda TaxID=27771 RepID=UPI0029C81B2D|nr:uncharacterized protein LOC132999740 [Limanda limanda]